MRMLSAGVVDVGVRSDLKESIRHLTKPTHA